MGLLAAYAFLPLVLHVSLYRFGAPDPEMQASRELLVLGMTALLAGMTLAYQRLLRIENRRLAEEEALAKEELAHLAFHDELTGLPNNRMKEPVRSSVWNRWVMVSRLVLGWISSAAARAPYNIR